MSNFDPSVPDGIPGNANTNAVLNYNGSAFEAQRGNTGAVLLAAASVSATTAVSVTNFNGRGLYAYMNITSGLPPGSASVTVALKIKAIPPGLTTASAVTVAAGPLTSATGCYVLCMYPGAIAGSASANSLVTTCGRPAPRDFLVVASISSGAGSFGCVMSLGLHTIL